jgi:hypothetical protein
MSRVSVTRLFAVTLVAFGCGPETFELLPQPPPSEAGGSGGAGSGASGMGGRGNAGGASGGRSGRDAGTLPEPDCPDWQPSCAPCPNDEPCPFGTLCDYFRNYCAPYCGTGFDGTLVQCNPPGICDKDRSVCVECTIDTHCGPDQCERGKCVPRPPPECFTNAQCENPEPYCFEGVCRPCSSNFHCDTNERCTMGRCEPDTMFSPR